MSGDGKVSDTFAEMVAALSCSIWMKPRKFKDDTGFY